MIGDESLNADNWQHVQSAIVLCGSCSRLCESLLECDIVANSSLSAQVKVMKDLFDNMSNELINYTIVTF